MKTSKWVLLNISVIILILVACKKNGGSSLTINASYPAIETSTTINLNSLANYANQAKPNYIVKDNTIN